MRTMGFERVGRVVVVAHGRKNPTDEEWNSCAAAVSDILRARCDFGGVLITSLGGAPNAGQRKRLLEFANSPRYRVCICTDSVLARGVITAINWIFPTPMKALPYDGVQLASDLLEVPASEREAVLDAVERLQSELQASDQAVSEPRSRTRG